MMLVGLASETASLKSCTIRSLVYNMKQTIKVESFVRKRQGDDDLNPSADDDQIEKLSSTDPAM